MYIIEIYWFHRNVLKSYKEEVSFVKEDIILHYGIVKTVGFLNSFQAKDDLLTIA
jgi:histidine ammonia-lyase